MTMSQCMVILGSRLPSKTPTHSLAAVSTASEKNTWFAAVTHLITLYRTWKIKNTPKLNSIKKEETRPACYLIIFTSI